MDSCQPVSRSLFERRFSPSCFWRVGFSLPCTRQRVTCSQVPPERCSIAPPRRQKNSGASVSKVRSVRGWIWRSEEHTSELQSHSDLVCRLLLEKKKAHV